VPDLCTYDYAIVRVVPQIERGEFINAGVILACASRGFLKARIALDEARLRLLDPHADAEAFGAALSAIPTICAGGAGSGPIGQLPVRARFDWLVAPRSTSVQVSPVHSGRCGDLDAVLERLMERMVRRPGADATG
jgi:hypothetical protein